MVGHETPRRGPVEWVIGVCARNPFVTLVAVAALAVLGFMSLRAVPLDAIPDLSDTQVIVFTEWSGRSPDLVEDQITYPLSTTFLAAPKVKAVRGQSFMGLSFLYVIFEDGTDIYWARSRVLEYLNTAAARLPDGVRPTIGPDATGVGWVYQYALVDRTGRHDLAKLRSLQDFTIRFWLESVEGVAEIASVGGFVKEYQVNVDPNRLVHHRIPLQDLVSALRRANRDVGGRAIEIAGHEQFVRGRGYIRSRADIEGTVLGADRMGTPIRVRDVATVTLGSGLQRGAADLDGDGQTVGGIVVMRYGENALNVIERVKKRIEEVKGGLPPGVEIVPVYDRSQLIERAIATLKDTLIDEMIVVSLVIALFLLHVRSALVACLTLPVAVLLAFIPMNQQGLTANIMSLGGIAIAIGTMVDAAVVIIDNVHKRLGAWQADGAPGDRRDVIIEATREVGPSIFFSLLIITVSFMPVFALQSTEGRLFQPLAYTKTYSMGFAAILAITAIPALAVLLIRGRIRSDRNFVNRWLIAGYTPLVRLAVRGRWIVLGATVAVAVATVPVFQRLGNEFMPPLNEGSILYMPTALPGMSVTEAGRILQAMDRRIAEFPEVERVFGKIGRSTSPTDPAPMSMVETVILLKPKEAWRPGVTWDGLIAEMDEKLKIPGMPNIWWMPIQTRTEMLTTGVRSALGVKVYGTDLAAIERTAVAIERALQDNPRTKPFTRSAFAERATGGYFLDFDIKRDAAARHGLNVDDVNDAILAAVGGLPATETVEGRERYSVVVRYAREYRESVEALERVLVPTRSGAQIPLTQVADIVFRTGPDMVRNEGGQLVGFVFVDVKNDIGIADYVELAKKAVAEAVPLPAGYRLDWVGQYTHLERAKERLRILVPLTVFTVFFMLFMHRGSFAETLFVMSAVPMSLIGAVWLVHLLGYKLSVAVWVGMIAMAGLGAEMGLLMLLYLDLAWRHGLADGAVSNRADLARIVAEGAGQRIRPMLMTALTLFIGLIPVMLSDGTGADVMKRIAAPLVGGTASALAVVLFVFPAIFALWRGYGLSAERPADDVSTPRSS